MTYATKLFLLLVGHAICDYPLQGDFLARGKNFSAPIPGVPWYQCMLAHCLIHAGSVYLITHSSALASLEFSLHFAIDMVKCLGATGFNEDQAMHVVCKVLWAAL